MYIYYNDNSNNYKTKKTIKQKIKILCRTIKENWIKQKNSYANEHENFSVLVCKRIM